MSVGEVSKGCIPPQPKLAQSPAPSISQRTVQTAAAREPMPDGQTRSKPGATRRGRSASASQMSTSARCELKRRVQPPPHRGEPTNGSSHLTKQLSVPLQPSACNLKRKPAAKATSTSPYSSASIEARSQPCRMRLMSTRLTTCSTPSSNARYRL